MLDLLSALVAALLVVLVWLLARRLRYARARVRPHRAGDGEMYAVHPAHSNPRGAADTLAAVNGRCIELLRWLRARYLRGPGGAAHPRRAAVAARLLARYSPDNLSESSPLNPEGDTSFTIDKGRVLALCLRERDPRRSGDPRVHDLHDMDTLTFVALHELAHVGVDVQGHPPAFWAAFRMLLREAREGGVLDAPDYARAPVPYCGMRITYNPLYDPEVEDL